MSVPTGCPPLRWAPGTPVMPVGRPLEARPESWTRVMSLNGDTPGRSRPRRLGAGEALVGGLVVDRLSDRRVDEAARIEAALELVQRVGSRRRLRRRGGSARSRARAPTSPLRGRAGASRRSCAPRRSSRRGGSAATAARRDRARSPRRLRRGAPRSGRVASARAPPSTRARRSRTAPRPRGASSPRRAARSRPRRRRRVTVTPAFCALRTARRWLRCMPAARSSPSSRHAIVGASGST